VTGATTSAKLKEMRSLIILVWTIWRERNAMIFDAKEKETTNIVPEIREKPSFGFEQAQRT
jgi:hypothetical protein